MTILLKVILICIGFLISTPLSSKSIDAVNCNKERFKHSINTYDYNQDLNIKLKDISLKENCFSLGEIYGGAAILTLEVENNDIAELELSNIDVYPYQNDVLTKCFVTTAKGDINGMVGYLKSGEKKDIKIGVALNDLENPLDLEFISADENQTYKITEHVKLHNKEVVTSDF